MRSIVAVTALVLAAACASVPATTTSAPPPSEADHTIDAYFSLLSGPAGARDWAAFRALLFPWARFHAMGVDEQGESAFYPQDLDEYVHHIDDFVSTRGFYHRDTCRRTFVAGRTATVVATFESRLEPTGDVIDRGVISFHLVRDQADWRIASVLWNSETADSPLQVDTLGCPNEHPRAVLRSTHRAPAGESSRWNRPTPGLPPAPHPR